MKSSILRNISQNHISCAFFYQAIKIAEPINIFASSTKDEQSKANTQNKPTYYPVVIFL
jgi:hypothetical protein